MKIIEMFIDENAEESGINAISVVENPAIESNFLTLSKNNKIQLKVVDEEKKILMGAILIPDIHITRVDEDGNEYKIFFSKKTVELARDLFMKRSRQSESTLEHESKLSGLTVVEFWIVEDLEKDKTALYGLDVQLGSLVGSVKVDNEKIYQEAKKGNIKGFSIEGFFTEKVIEQAKLSNNEFLNEIKNILNGNENI